MRAPYPTKAAIASRLEDVRWMAETGECLDGAARRLGLTGNALERWLERNDRAALAALLARQPRDHNRQVGDGPAIWELTGLAVRRRARENRKRREGVAA